MRPALSALLAIGVLATAGCGGEPSASTTGAGATTAGATNATGTFAVTTHGRYRYPTSIVNSYMRSCTNGVQKREAFCGCTLNELSNSVSVRDFARIGKTGRASPRMQRLFKRAGEACKSKL